MFQTLFAPILDFEKPTALNWASDQICRSPELVKHCHEFKEGQPLDATVWLSPTIISQNNKSDVIVSQEDAGKFSTVFLFNPQFVLPFSNS